MTDIIATVHGSEALRRELARARDQLPFTQSLAINRTVNDIQQGIRDDILLNPRFNLRRPDFVLKTVYRRPGVWPRGDFSSKAQLIAAVRIHPDRDFLAKFEEGGEKRPLSGRHLVLPTIRLQEPAKIIRRGDPLHLSKLPGGTGKRSRRRASVFLVEQKGTGRKFFVQRLGENLTRLIYTFKERVRIPKQLGFYLVGERVLNRVWEKNLGEALDRALKTRR